MTDQPAAPSSAEPPLDELIHGCLDGTLPQAALDELGHRLRDHPAAARQFARAALLHSSLRDLLAARETLQLSAVPPERHRSSSPHDTTTTIPADAGFLDGALPGAALPPRSPLPARESGSGPTPAEPRTAFPGPFRHLSHHRRLLRPAVAAALVLGLALAAGVWWSGRPAAQAETGRLARTAGTVNLIRGGQLMSVSDEQAGLAILVGDRLHGVDFDSSAELFLDDGSRLQMLGRFALAIRQTPGQSTRLMLESGALALNVVPQPAGRMLVVKTPHSRVDVIGTEFLVREQRESTRVHVTSGEVQVSATDSTETVSVSAGQVAVVDGLRCVVLHEEPPLPDHWQTDFSSGLPAGWHGAAFVPGSSGAEIELPPGSTGAVQSAWLDRFGGHYLLGVRASDPRGLFRVTETTHIEITFTVTRAEPDWLNMFVACLTDTSHPTDRPRQVSGRSSPQRAVNFKCIELSEVYPSPGQWRTVTIPLSRFRSWHSRDGRNPQWTGASPGPQDVLTTFWAGAPPPDRGLLISRLRVLPDGPGRVVVREE